MNVESEFVIIGNQRTGTTVLTLMLNSNEHIFTAKEIFHHKADGIDSFANFCIKINPKYGFFMSDREHLYGKYINMLRRETNKNIIGVNIKYNSCHNLDRNWKGLSAPPSLFPILRSRGAKIIHTVRKNTFRVALSGILASSRGIWHISRGTARSDDAITVDPTQILRAMRNYEAELSAFNRFTSGYPNILTLEYENMFEEGRFSQHTAGSVQRFLNVEGTFDLVPQLEKATPPKWADAISNWEIIQKSVAEAGYEHML